MLFWNRQTHKKGPPVVDQGDDACHDLAALQIVSREARPSPLVLQLVEVILRIAPVPVVLGQCQYLILQRGDQDRVLIKRTIFNDLGETKSPLLLWCRTGQPFPFHQNQFIADAPPEDNYSALAGPARKCQLRLD